MRRASLLLLLFALTALADNQEKAEKKALDQQAKTFVKEAKDLEKAGKLLEARAHYANSQSFTDSKEATEAIPSTGKIWIRVSPEMRSCAARYFPLGEKE